MSSSSSITAVRRMRGRGRVRASGTWSSPSTFCPGTGIEGSLIADISVGILVHMLPIFWNYKTDELGKEEDIYSVGDIIDRGDNNLECIDICISNGIKVVKGNHEDMAIDYLFKEK